MKLKYALKYRLDGILISAAAIVAVVCWYRGGVLDGRSQGANETLQAMKKLGSGDTVSEFLENASWLG